MTAIVLVLDCDGKIHYNKIVGLGDLYSPNEEQDELGDISDAIVRACDA